LAGIVKLDN